MGFWEGEEGDNIREGGFACGRAFGGGVGCTELGLGF